MIDTENKVMMIFLGLGFLLGGLVVGVPMLSALFATGGAFGQLEGVAAGVCAYRTAPGGVVEGTVYRTFSGARLVPPQTFDVVPVTAGEFGTADGLVVLFPGTNAVIAAAPTGGAPAITSCDTNGVDKSGTAFAGDGSSGNVSVTIDGQLSSNPYSGILIALIILIPLGVVAFFAMRFISRAQ